MRFGGSTLFYLHIHCNLVAVHGEQYSLVVLYRKGKVQSCEWFVKKWFDRQHTNMSSLYQEGFGKGQKRHAVSKCSGYLKKVLQSILLCAFTSLAARQWRRGQSRPHPGGGSGVWQMEAILYRITPTKQLLAGSAGCRTTGFQERRS